MVTLKVELELTIGEKNVLRDVLRDAIFQRKETLEKFAENDTDGEIRRLWNDNLQAIKAVEAKFDLALKHAVDAQMRGNTTHRFVFESIRAEPPHAVPLLICFEQLGELEWRIARRYAGSYFGFGEDNSAFAMSEREMIEGQARWALLPASEAQNEVETR